MPGVLGRHSLPVAMEIDGCTVVLLLSCLFIDPFVRIGARDCGAQEGPYDSPCPFDDSPQQIPIGHFGIRLKALVCVISCHAGRR
jgi:hypothetical protein